MGFVNACLGNFVYNSVVCYFFFVNQVFHNVLPIVQSECQTVGILIRSNNFSGLIWVQNVWKYFQQTTLANFS